MTDPRIMLAGGTLFDLLDPAGSHFTINDIAHGLGRVCRFAGHTNRFYSVAEHSVLVARLVPPEHARAALLHDASEAFIGDVTRPLKALLPDYRAIEARIEDAIASRFLSPAERAVVASEYAADPLKVPPIKRADMAMCLVEARELMPTLPGYWNIPVDPDTLEAARKLRLNCDRPEYATAAWLRAWHRYGHRMERLQAQEHDQLAAAEEAGYERGLSDARGEM